MYQQQTTIEEKMKKIINFLFNFLTKRAQKAKPKEKNIYNAAGKVILNFYNLINPSITTYEYDANGREISNKYMYDGHLNSMTKTEVMEDGRFKETRITFPDKHNKLEERESVIYYSSPDNSILYDENNQIVRVEEAEKDENRRAINTELRLYDNGKLSATEVHHYQYDERGNRTNIDGKTTEADGSIKYISSSEYNYDEKNLMVHRIETFKAMTKDHMIDNEHQYRYQYDEQGREIRCLTYEWDRIRSRSDRSCRDQFYFGDDVVEVSNHITLNFMITTYVKKVTRPDGSRVESEWYLPNWFGKLLVWCLR